MNYYIALFILSILSQVSSCGVYRTNCEDYIVSGFSSKLQAYVVCDDKGFATKIEWTEMIYSNADCSNLVSGELRSIFNTVKTEDSTDKNNAQYTATYASAIVSSEDTESFNMMIQCNPVLVKGEKHNLNEIVCTYNGEEIFDKENLEKDIPITIQFTTDSALFTGLSTHLFSKQTSVAYQPYDWYMIRNGYLGPEYSSKIVSAVLSIILVLYDGLTRKRWDYLITFVFGTVLWILLEYCLLKSGVREYQAGYLGGKELGFWAAIIIRCMQECGFLMVVSMFDGDRLCDCMKGKKSRPSICRNLIELGVVFVLLSVSSVSNMLSGKKEFRAVGSPDVAGRRNMTQPVSVALFCGMTVICIIFVLYYQHKKYFLRRTIGQTIFYTWVTGLGMVIEYFCNARWVEVGHYPDVIAMPSGGHEFLAFMYDLIIEVIIPPIFIYFLMVILRILPDFNRDGYYDEEKPSKKTLPITTTQPAVPAPTAQLPLPDIELLNDCYNKQTQTIIYKQTSN